MTHDEGEVAYTMDTPVHVVSRLHAELVCFEAGMDMKKLEWLRHMATNEQPFGGMEWDTTDEIAAQMHEVACRTIGGRETWNMGV